MKGRRSEADRKSSRRVRFNLSPNHNRYSALNDEMDEVTNDPLDDNVAVLGGDFTNTEQKSTPTKDNVKFKRRIFNRTLRCPIDANNNFVSRPDPSVLEVPAPAGSTSDDNVSDGGSRSGTDETCEFVAGNEISLPEPILDDNEPDLDVNFTSLEPANLIFIPIAIAGRPYKALVDSGATHSLMKESIARECEAQLDSSITFKIRGVGKATVSTMGIIRVPCQILDLRIPDLYFDVALDNSIRYDIVLGLDFLMNSNFTIDASARMIQHDRKDKGRVKYFLSSEGNVDRVMHENIPVVSLVDRVITESSEVPVGVELSSIDEASFVGFYEGRPKNRRLQSHDGLVDTGGENLSVIVDRKKGFTDHGIKIKRGEILGLMSTLVEVEQVEESNVWCREEIEGQIKVGDELSDEQKEAVYGMLEKSQAAMSKSEFDIGRANVIPHRIELTDTTPVWQRPRRFSEPINREIDRQCDELLAMDVIEHSNSAWSSPVVPVVKKSTRPDGKPEIRLCVDYRKLNRQTLTEKFSMPDLAENIYGAHGCKYFTTLDLVKGYYQVPLDDNSKQLTAFSTPHGHYQFKTLSFGMKNSGIAFQKNMQQVLSNVCFKNVHVYIDDLLITSKTFEEHLRLVAKVLNTLAANGIKIKLSKCEFFRKEVVFLGHIIGQNGIRKEPAFLNSITNYPRPTTVEELRQFLGVINFRRRFVRDCSVLAKPLSELTGGKKKQKLVWSEDMVDAFDRLKRELSEDVLLAYPDYSPDASPLEVFVDASAYGAGGALMQLQDGEYRVIAYSSTTFSPAETRYSTLERELTALRWSVRNFSPFLLGTKFIVFTDHKPLVYLENMAITNSRLMRTYNEIAEYDFEIRYRPGKDNEAADALSRAFVPESNELEASTPIGLPEGLQLGQKSDGGGDSYFVSLLYCLRALPLANREGTAEVPGDALTLRELLVDNLARNLSKYGLENDKIIKRQLKGMKRPGALPRDELSLVACDVFHVKVNIHHGMRWPVVFQRDKPDDNEPEIHLQCISGVHFNPVIGRKTNAVQGSEPQRYVNSCSCEVNPKKEQNIQDVNLSFDSHAEDEIEPKISLCPHDSLLGLCCFLEIGSVKFCAIIDLGSQVSLISSDIVRRLLADDVSLDLDAPVQKQIIAIDGSKCSMDSVIKFSCSIMGNSMVEAVPFGVVEANDIPCCCVLGMNFIERNKVKVSFGASRLELCDGAFASVAYGNVGNNLYCGNVMNLAVETAVESEDDELNVQGVDESEDDVDVVPPVEFVMPSEKIVAIQQTDFAIRMVATQFNRNVPFNRWHRRCLRPYRPYARQMSVDNGVVVRKIGQFLVPVLPFDRIASIVLEIHVRALHVGMNKLTRIVNEHFWHPAINKVIRDVCVTCTHCQIYKVSPQHVTPPTLKIVPKYPYDLIAVDLLQFPRSNRGNVALLMVIDHKSKFLMAAPIKNKTSSTVANALAEHILPCMLRVPNRILSDNGPEFRGNDFNELLQSHNIAHVYSTSYRAASNGCIERSNRTIIQLLRSIGSDNPSDWDSRVKSALMVYNSTVHREIGDSPSQFILRNSHNTRCDLPVDRDTMNAWSQGNENFAPFRLNQKVAYKIQRIGNQTVSKLLPKYKGPFRITKVQTNRVTYEITDDTGAMIKAHHRQLKLWYDSPAYLNRHLLLLNRTETEVEENDDGSDHSRGTVAAGGGDFSSDESSIASLDSCVSESCMDSDRYLSDSSESLMSGVSSSSYDSDCSVSSMSSLRSVSSRTSISSWSHSSESGASSCTSGTSRSYLDESGECLDERVSDEPVSCTHDADEMSMNEQVDDGSVNVNNGDGVNVNNGDGVNVNNGDGVNVDDDGVAPVVAEPVDRIEVEESVIVDRLSDDSVRNLTSVVAVCGTPSPRDISFDEASLYQADVNGNAPRASTPTDSACHQPQELSISPLTSQLIASCCGENIQLLSWVNSSWSEHCEHVELAINALSNLEESLVSERGVSEIPAASNVSHYSGMGESCTIDNRMSAVRAALNTVRNHAAQVSSIAKQYRPNRDIIREYVARNSPVVPHNSPVEFSETPDVYSLLPTLAVHSRVSTGNRYLTRSRGSARDLPHVQPRILEYRKNK